MQQDAGGIGVRGFPGGFFRVGGVKMPAWFSGCGIVMKFTALWFWLVAVRLWGRVLQLRGRVFGVVSKPPRKFVGPCVMLMFPKP